MKKKHLRALSAIQSWLAKHSEDSMHLEEAFSDIKRALDKIEEVAVEDAPLPAPKEIEAEPTTIALYSDGGCRGNPGPGAFAFVIQKHSGEVLAEGVEYEGHTTNNKMELSGPLKGLQELLHVLPVKNSDPLLTKVLVVTDSKYVVDGMKSWVKGWKAKDWKKADGKSPENLDLWQQLDQVKDHFFKVEWMWVKGHGGHPQNEYCDRKANEVMDAHSST